MRCETCHGTGKLTCRLNGVPYVYPRLPCNACQGSGLAHCCEGDCAQPEPPAREDEDG